MKSYTDHLIIAHRHHLKSAISEIIDELRTDEPETFHGPSDELTENILLRLELYQQIGFYTGATLYTQIDEPINQPFHNFTSFPIEPDEPTKTKPI